MNFKLADELAVDLSIFTVYEPVTVTPVGGEVWLCVKEQAAGLLVEGSVIS